jgi:hypothetical protein
LELVVEEEERMVVVVEDDDDGRTDVVNEEVVIVEVDVELVRVVVVEGTCEELDEVVVLLDWTTEVVVLVDELLWTREVVVLLDDTTEVDDEAIVVELEEIDGDVVVRTVVVEDPTELLELSVGVVVVWLLDVEGLTVLELTELDELTAVEDELLGTLSVPFLVYMLNRLPAPQNWKSEPSHVILQSLSATRLYPSYIVFPQ